MAEPRTVRENANTLSSVQIAEILPHRYPFALVDRVLDYEPGQWAIGRKCVTRNEEFFNGHFPAQPVMPGVLLLEALAQTGAVAALHCELVQQHGAVGVGKASAWVDGKCAVTAELTFVLTDAAE